MSNEMIENRVPVLGFVAPSGTGKTTLLRKLVPVLDKRGLRVGYLKHAHHGFDLDVPGKDSYELREAGAAQTLIASSERWALQTESRTRGEDPVLDEMLPRFDADRLDLILVEGFKHAAYPKIEIHRSTLGKDPLYPGDPDIVAVIADRTLPGDSHPPLLPPEDPEAIADFIQRYLASAPSPVGALRAELVRHYRWLRRYGCNDSHSGNASVRDGDGFWVTPTGCCADTLEPRELVFCPLEGECPAGGSLDASLHQAVYRSQPAARAVLHSHGPYSVALSFAGQDFRPGDFEGSYYFESVPVLSIPYDQYLEKSPELVAEALAAYPIAMVRGHGVYAWGESVNQAYKWTTSLELSAKTYVVARQAAAI
jgi:molybdopterin-guanine dinucleotide biosynthesis protein MobB